MLSSCIRREFHCWATVIPGMMFLAIVSGVGLESLLQYELVKQGVGTKSTCVYRDYLGGVELQGISCLHALMVQ